MNKNGEIPGEERNERIPSHLSLSLVFLFVSFVCLGLPSPHVSLPPSPLSLQSGSVCFNHHYIFAFSDSGSVFRDSQRVACPPWPVHQSNTNTLRNTINPELSSCKKSSTWNRKYFNGFQALNSLWASGETWKLKLCERETQTLKRLLHSREKSLAVIKIRIVFFMTENPFHEFYTIRQQGEFIKSVLSQHSSYN